MADGLDAFDRLEKILKTCIEVGVFIQFQNLKEFQEKSNKLKYLDELRTLLFN